MVGRRCSHASFLQLVLLLRKNSVTSASIPPPQRDENFPIRSIFTETYPQCLTAHALLSVLYFFLVAHSGATDRVSLKTCEVIRVEDYEKPSDYLLVANNAELMAGVEDLVHTWSKQIEQVSSRALRRYIYIYTIVIDPNPNPNPNPNTYIYS